VSWATLRATRSNPPAAAAEDRARRATYVSALEQAEQLFRAASVVGPATAPVLLYYGLSQAGRAVIAAASSVRDDWRLTGHGIKLGDLTSSLPSISVYADGARGSFFRLSEVLESPTWGKSHAIGLSQLWDALPEAAEWPIQDDTDRRPAHRLEYHRYEQQHPLLSMAVCNLPPRLTQSAFPGVDLRTYLSSYPTLGAYEYVRASSNPDSPPEFLLYQNGHAELNVNVVVDGGKQTTEAQRRALFQQIGSRHGAEYDDFYLVPAIGNNNRPMHPLMTWWAVLYTLSMLARYQPAEWSEYVDVDRSSFAVSIEQMLSVALVVVPELIAVTIGAVRDQAPTS
jgi:hypothetical protein